LKKYVLSKKRAKFQKKLSPKASRYYDNLMRINKLRVRKELRKRKRKQRKNWPALLALIIFYLLTLLVCWLRSF
jgi:transposase